MSLLPSPAARLLRPGLLGLTAALALGACSSDNDTDTSATGASRFEVRLTDAPGPYEEVNVDVQAVQIHVSDDADEASWQPLRLLRPGVINLLDLAGGNDVLLASADFPPGRISQLRLVLGTNNSVKLSGDPTRYTLQTPSAQQSGLKLKIDAELRRDVTYQVMLDFDAAKSIVERGNGSNRFSLKPVIRTITTAIAGGVQGHVEPPADFASGVRLISASRDTLTTTLSPTTGNFLFRGVTGGTYTLLFEGANARAGQTKQQAVSVVADRITDVGTVQF